MSADTASTSLGQFVDTAASGPMNSTGTYRARGVSITQVGDASQAVAAEDGRWGSVSFVDFFSPSRVDASAWSEIPKL